MEGIKMWEISSKKEITIFSEEIAHKEVIDDALPGADGDVHVVGLVAEAIEVVFPLRVLRFPRRLIR